MIWLQLLAKSLTGEEIARELIYVLMTYRIGPSNLLAAKRDRASTNNVAMRTVAVVYLSMLDVGCFPHTLLAMLVNTSTLLPLKFLGLLGLVCLRIARPERFGGRKQGSQWLAIVRWWSRWEVYNQLMVQFGDLEPFLQRNDDIAPATRAKFLPFFSDQQLLTPSLLYLF